MYNKILSVKPVAKLMSYQISLTDEIDLLNVSFDGQSAPDRISAKARVMELRRIAPLRRYGLWHLNCPGLWFPVLRSFLCYILYKVPQLSHLS